MFHHHKAILYSHNFLSADHSVHLKTGALQPPSASSATTPQEALLAAAQSGDAIQPSFPFYQLVHAF